MNEPNRNKQVNLHAWRLQSARIPDSRTNAEPITEAELEAYRFRGNPIQRSVSPGLAQPSPSSLQFARRITAAPSKARPGRFNLTPAAPVPSQVSASTEEGIRITRQPRQTPPSQSWAAVAAGVTNLATAVSRAWREIRRRLHELLPRRVALQRVERPQREGRRTRRQSRED